MRFKLPRRAPGDYTVDEKRRTELVKVLLKMKTEQEAAERAEADRCQTPIRSEDTTEG